MGNDEQAISQWFDRWMTATKEGDLDLANSLIADDAVFLVPSVGRMDKESFAAAMTATDPNYDFQLDSSIQEVKVLGDHAWLWTQSDLVIIEKATQSRTVWSGHSLSIMKRDGDSWLIIRDANTMVPQPEE